MPKCINCKAPAEFLVCWKPPYEHGPARLPHCKTHGVERLNSLLSIQSNPVYVDDPNFSLMGAHLEPLDGVDVKPDPEGESWDD